MGLSVMMFSLFLLISILTYNNLDPSFNTATKTDIIFNQMGVSGAYFSDLFIQMFGIVSFFIVFIIGKIGFNIFKLKQNIYNVYLKIIMFIIFIMSSCALVSKLFNGINYWDYESWGGTIGYYINNLTIYLSYKFLLFFYLVCSILSMIIVIDFNYKKVYIYLHKIKEKIFLLFKLLLKGLLLLLKIFIPRTILYKIKTIIEKRKNKKKKYINYIKNQNNKIKHLEQYIENIKNNEQEEEEVDFFKKNTDSISTEVDNNIKTKNKNHSIFSVLMGKGNKTEKNSLISKYKLPTLDLLMSSDDKVVTVKKEDLIEQANDLIKILKDFKINGKIISVKAGPVITLHEFEPSAGTKSARIIGLADDIARNLRVKSTRISVISERNVMGIELPNKVRNTIFLKDIFRSEEYTNSRYMLPIVLGCNIAGDPVIMDLTKAPHLLIAGTTGSGKSVSINTMILSLLYKFTPDECKLIMIDPKMLELSVYEGIPHLLTPVVTSPQKAILALKWVVSEMENRYKIMSSLGVRNVYNYNEKVKEALNEGTQLFSKVLVGYDEYGEPIYENKELETKKLPFIVVIVDEMADLMITAGKDIEALIQRIAQMARAAGIHIIMATQRPSVDVVTGVIKANFPSRVSFLVSSKIDSKVIIGEQGAEQLLGMGDMLYMFNGGKIDRAHGPFVSDKEVENIVNYILNQKIKPEYVKTMVENNEDENNSSGNFDISINGSDVGDEDLYRQAIEIIKRDKKVSISYLQRKLSIGYNKSAKLVERMEEEGIVTPANNSGKREILEN